MAIGSDISNILFFSLAWTPAAPRRARVHQHQRDYGSANSIEHFNPEFNAENGSTLAKNQSQPYLLTFHETKEKKENEPGTGIWKKRPLIGG